MKLNKFKIVFFVTLISLSCIFVSFIHKKEIIYDAEDIVNRMFVSIDHVKTLRYSLKIEERIEGKLEHRESKVKLQVSPRKIYLQIKNQELLWVQGTNEGNALVSPGTFPYINLNLDPLGQIVRKGQHHTIQELGFGYIYDLIKNYRDVIFKDEFKKHFFITGEEIHEGRPCYKLSVLIPDFAWKTYRVLKGENIVTIARKLYLSEFMILEGNPSISWYYDVKEGQVINIPNSYAKYALLLIDKELMLPVYSKLIDDKGLFEHYQYLDLKVNVPFAADEFTKGFKGYKF